LADPVDGRPTCAVLADPNLSINTESVEADLQGRGTVTLLERAHIDAIVQEHKLQTLLGANGFAERAQLGHLLKADFLVILRAEGGSSGGVRATICETQRGLRLASAVVGDAKSVGDLMTVALAASSGPVREVAAVTPFVDQDLTLQHADLSQGYAKIAEQVLHRHPGVATVELAEARALAAEIAAAGAADPTRPLPIYINGDFRYSTDPPEKVTIHIELRRGEQVLSSTSDTDLAPQAVPAAIDSAVDRLLQEALNAEHIMAPDSDVEAAALAERAEIFRKLGIWSEAMGLIDASLLLKPSQPWLHRDAVDIISRRVGMAGPVGKDPVDPYWTDQKVRRAALDEGLSHLEAYMRAPRQKFRTAMGEPAWRLRNAPQKDEGGREYQIVGSYFAQVWFNSGDRQYADAMHAKIAQMVLRVLRAKSASDAHDDVPSVLGFYADFTPDSQPELALQRRLAVVEQCPQAFDEPNSVINFLMPQPFHYEKVSTTHFNQVLARLSVVPSLECRAAAEKMRKRTAAGFVPFSDYLRPSDLVVGPATAPAESRAQAPSAPGGASAQLSFEKINLTFVQPPASTPNELQPGGFYAVDLAGWCPAGPGIDAVWNNHFLFLMKSKGTLTPITRIRTHGVCYDGKYIWAAAPEPGLAPPGNPNPAPSSDLRLLVIDPVTESVRVIDTPAGMAPIRSFVDGYGATDFLVAPIAPGRVCVAGDFGRTWIATASIDAQGASSFHVIFEAREQNDYTQGGWQNPHLAFTPVYMVTLKDTRSAGAAAPPVRVLVGREGDQNTTIDYHPLIVDPDKGAVSVLSDSMWVHPNAPTIWVQDGSAYWTDYSLEDRQPALFRMGFPSLRREKLCLTPVEGAVVMVDQNVLIDNGLDEMNKGLDKWAIGQNVSGPFKQLTARLPVQNFVHFYTPGRSQFYGYVLTNAAMDNSFALNLSGQATQTPAQQSVTP
jgi:hypothetical protein